MKKLWKRFGIIAIVVIIGFSFAACSDDGGGGGGPGSGPNGGPNGGGGGGGNYNGNTLKSGTPSNAILSKYGLSESQTQALFNAARAVNVGDADYMGYYEEVSTEDGISVEVLAYVWKNKNQGKYNQVCSALSSDPNYWWLGELGDSMSMEYAGFPPDTILTQGGMNLSTFDMATAIYYLKSYAHEGNETVPAGTLCVAYTKMNLGF